MNGASASSPMWSSFSDTQLRMRASVMDVAALARSLGRTASDVRKRASALGVALMEPKDAEPKAAEPRRSGPASSRWTKEEDACLRERISAESMRAIAERLGRTVDAVKNRVRVLGLSRGRTVRPWTEEETAFLRANYPAMPAQDIAERLGRSFASVKARIAKLGLGEDRAVWTPEQDEELRERYARDGGPALARRFGRPLRAVHWRAQLLGVKKRQTRAWTAEETARLEELSPSKTVNELARMLGRTAGSVAAKLFELRLQARPASEEPPQWSPGETDLLRDLYAKGANLSDISAMVHRSQAACRRQASALGLRRAPPARARPSPDRKPRPKPKPAPEHAPVPKPVPKPNPDPKPKPNPRPAPPPRPAPKPKREAAPAEPKPKPDLTDEETVAKMSRIDILKALLGM